MAIYKTISSKEIVRKVFRDLKPDNDNWIDDAIEWIGEALEHIGASTQLEHKQTVLNIVDHKTALPHDLYYINQVAVNTAMSTKDSDIYDTIVAGIDELKAQIAVAQAAGLEYTNVAHELQVLTNQLIVMEGAYFKSDVTMMPLQYSASTFHASMHCEGCVNEFSQYKDTYVVENDYLKTSFQTGKLCLSYTAFPTDHDCYPMVPADISFKEAMFWYIYKKLLLFNPNIRKNGIDYTFAEQQWKYYCTQARNAANYPDIDRMASFMDQWVRLIPNLNRHDSFFEDLNTRENLSRY